MKYLLFLIVLIFHSCTSKDKGLIGSWKLYEIRQPEGITEADKELNKFISAGFFTRHMSFTDSTCKDILYQNGLKKVDEYIISENKKSLMPIAKNGENLEILECEGDTLKILRRSRLVCVFVRENN